MTQTKLTRGGKRMIETAIQNLEPAQRNNVYDICFEITKLLEEGFAGDSLEYQAERMRMDTTAKIINNIHTYFQKHQSRSSNKKKIDE